MATVFHAICLTDYCPAPEEDPTFVLKRGEEYTIFPGGESHPDQVRVCSRYWVWVPAKLFAGIVPLGGK